MKNTRQRILDYLGAHPDATAGQLANRLRLTHADIRYHLNLLLGEKRVLKGDRQMQLRSRGRPARSYRLAASFDQGNFQLLSAILLAEILSDLSLAEQEVFLGRLASRLARGHAHSGESAQGSAPEDQQRFVPGDRPSMSTRLVRAVLRLNDLGFQARWEAHAESPQLILQRSPFSPLHAEQPALDELERRLIETLLVSPVRRVPVSNALLSRGVHAIYRVIATSQD
jgi:predicted ArsR family transcriptional regulator